MLPLSQLARPSIVQCARRLTARPPSGSPSRVIQLDYFRRAAPSLNMMSTISNKHSVSGKESSIIYSESQPADLPDRVLRLSAWNVSPSNMGLVRQFTFPTFAAAWRFMSLVAEECKAKRHHPSWHNLYNQVTVEWTTHRPQGLSIKDVEMAEFCDRTAEQIGLQEQNNKSETATTDKETA